MASYLCEIAQVSRSGFYAWLKAAPSRYQREEHDRNDYKLIEEIFIATKRKGGWRTIKMNLEKEYAILMNHKKILRIMRKFQLVTVVRRKNPYRKIAKTTQSHKTLRNLLKRKFDHYEPQKVMVTDITYLYYAEGRKAYLSVIKDGSTREILAYHLSTSLEMDLVLKTLDRLQETLGGNIHPDAIIHSDQGFHYTHPEFQRVVKELLITQSMSRKGNCLDNASIESFFGHMKDEINIKECQSFTEVQNKIDEYIEYYNCQRYQWGLKKMTPNQYRDHLIAS
jgi:putative transposase